MSPDESRPAERSGRFLWLLVALVGLLVAYPWFGDTPGGAALGGIVALAVLTTAVYAVRTHRALFSISLVLAVVAAVGDVTAFIAGTRGHPFVEGAFAAFYAFTTACMFAEVVRRQTVTQDTIHGVLCVYLMLGVTFGTLYDFLETIHPGSFATEAIEGRLGFRSLIYFSFMTLTTVGYGDITPDTHVAQSLTILESSTGVLFVAVLVARIIGIYGRR